MARTFGSDFRKLVRSFGRHHEVRQADGGFDELASARIALDEARSDVREHGHRFETAPENSKFVEPGRERSGMSTFGRVAAVIAGLLVLFGAFLAIQALKRVGGSPIEFVDGTTTQTFSTADSGRCVWTVRGDIDNGSDRAFDLQRAWVVTPEGNATLMGGRRTFEPGVTPGAEIAFLLWQTECPAEIGDVSSGRIVINNSFGIRP